MSKKETYRAILLIGAPGSGKGTQGVTLGKVPQFFHCACGDVFRTLDTRTPLGQAFVEYSSRGELVPDELTVKLWKVRIEQNEESYAFHSDIDYLVLDGIPRNVHQAELLENVLDVQHVFHLHCADRAKLVARLKKRAIKDNRLDDANETIISHRLDTYDKETAPLLEYYGTDKVTKVDAMQPPIAVLATIVNTLLQKGIATQES